MTEALQNGALQSLKKVELGRWTLGDNDLMGFADALEDSGRAMQVVDLIFRGCEFGAEGVRILADRLRRDAFPALKQMSMTTCSNITDVGVVAITKALLEAEQTLLTDLVSNNVGMGDEGITRLASLVTQGRMEEMEELVISKNDEVTHQGIIALARAIDQRELPMLQCFNMMKLSGVTVEGFDAMVYSLIKGCPWLTEINLTGSVSDDDSHCGWIAGMLKAAGRADKVNVAFNTPEDDGEDDDE